MIKRLLLSLLFAGSLLAQSTPTPELRLHRSWHSSISRGALNLLPEFHTAYYKTRQFDTSLGQYWAQDTNDLGLWHQQRYGIRYYTVRNDWYFPFIPPIQHRIWFDNALVTDEIIDFEVPPLLQAVPVIGGFNVVTPEWSYNTSNSSAVQFRNNGGQTWLVYYVEFKVSAWEITDRTANWESDPGVAIPGPQITVRGLQVSPNGYVQMWVKANDAFDITPSTSKPLYRYAIAFTRYIHSAPAPR